MKNFPLALYTPIYSDKWIAEANKDLFTKYLERWREQNALDDRCASLVFSYRGGHENRLTYLEALALTQSGLLPPEMFAVNGSEIEISEHAVHSVVEFFSRVQTALDIFRAQIESIKHTPNGRIRPLEEPEPE